MILTFVPSDIHSGIGTKSRVAQVYSSTHSFVSTTGFSAGCASYY